MEKIGMGCILRKLLTFNTTTPLPYGGPTAAWELSPANNHTSLEVDPFPVEPSDKTSAQLTP